MLRPSRRQILRHMSVATARSVVAGQGVDSSSDCGPNNEVFSFHSGGANCLFMDGHVMFLREEISPLVLRALVTRNGGAAEVAHYKEAVLH